MGRFSRAIIGLLSTGIFLFTGNADAEAEPNDFAAWKQYAKSGTPMYYYCANPWVGDKEGRILQDKNVTRIYYDIFKANSSLFKFAKAGDPAEWYYLNPDIYIQDTSANPDHPVGQCIGGLATIVISSYDMMTAVFPNEYRTSGYSTHRIIDNMWKGKTKRRSLDAGNIYTTSTLANSIAHEMGHNRLKHMGRDETDERQADIIGMELLERTQWYSPTAHNYDLYGFKGYSDDKHPSDAEREKMKLDYIRNKTNGRVFIDKDNEVLYVDGHSYDFLDKNALTPSRYERTIQALGNIAYLYSKGISVYQNGYFQTGDQLFHNGSKQSYIVVKRDKIGLPPKIVDAYDNGTDDWFLLLIHGLDN